MGVCSVQDHPAKTSVGYGAEIRRPTEDEWPQILEILEPENFHRIGGPEMAAFPLCDCFVALVEGRVAGVAGYQVLDESTAKNTLTVVAAKHRGRGIGAALKHRCMDHLRALGIKRLYTNCDDTRMIQWNIQQFGFSPTGQLIPKLESYGRKDADHWVNLVKLL